MLRLGQLLAEKDKQRIHQSAIALLEKVGFVCNHAETLEYFRQAGCKIGKELDKPKKARQVLFNERIVGEALKKAPGAFTLYPTSPGYKELNLLSGEIYFLAQGGDYIWDLKTNRLRPGTTQDMVSMCRLGDACENISGGGPAVYWLYDLVPQDRYEMYGLWDISFSIYCLHNGKPKFDVYSTATDTEVPTQLRTWQTCAGGPEAFRKKPCASLVVSPTSPFFLEGRNEPGDPWGHADSLVLMAKAGAPISIEPCGLLGMSGPVTVAGLVAQTIAEFLGMNVAVQAINPGNPVLLNDYTGSVDMSSGQKQEARPEANLVHLGVAEMAHHLNVPVFTINCSGAVEADAQMAWECMAIVLSQYLSGVDIIGSLGGVSTDDVVDPRAQVMANEIASWVKHFAKGIRTDEETVPLDLMVELGAAPLGGDYLGAEHTLKWYKDTLWRPSKLTSSLARDAWVEAGEVRIMSRARDMVEEILAKHEPKVPESQQKALRELVAEILDREGVKGGEAKRIMDLTYWKG